MHVKITDKDLERRLAKMRGQAIEDAKPDLVARVLMTLTTPGEPHLGDSRTAVTLHTEEEPST